MGYIISQSYRDKELGVIHIVVRSNARSFRARWKGSALQVTVPKGVTVERYNEVLNGWRESLKQTKPKTRYYDGQHIDLESLHIVIEASLERADHISCHFDETPCVVRISKDIDFSLTTVEQSISRIICKISQYHAPKLVLEIAEDESKRLGIYPAHYVISNGARTLGRCSTRKIISLSSRLAFLPEELRRYVICHELAHLKEMNHSPRFHALVNEYTNGREEELEQKLRKFEWPIIR